MTFFGKLLVVLNLIVGIGMAMWSVGVYTQRPYWFNEIPDGAIDPGNTPVTFKGLSAEIDALGKTAAVASQNWGIGLKSLRVQEKVRKDRQAIYAARLQMAWQGPVAPGSPQDVRAKGPAFYVDVIDDTTGLIDLTTVAMDQAGKPKPIAGPDGKPLEGADTLMDEHRKQVDVVYGDGKTTGLLLEIKALRDQQVKLQADVAKTETKILKQFVIREEVQAEVLFLKDFRINVGSDQETVYARKKQLQERLRLVMPPKRD